MISKESKIYVAGHQGMVGSAIMRRLEAEDYRNTVVRTRGELDLLDQASVWRFFEQEKPEVVFLAAARVGGIMANMTDLTGFLYENLQIQNNVIHSAAVSGVNRFIFLGSSCIYPLNAPQPLKEDSFLTGPFEPTNEGYALAKIAGMRLCSYLANDGVWDCLNIIPCNLYGPGDNFDSVSSHVMAALVKRFTDAEGSGENEVVCWGTGVAKREFLHVDDLVGGMFMLLESNPYGGEPVNIGYGTDVSIKELAELIANQCAFSGRIAWDKTKPDGMKRKLMDNSRMQKLGFKPRVSLERGVALLIDEYRSLGRMTYDE